MGVHLIETDRLILSGRVFVADAAEQLLGALGGALMAASAQAVAARGAAHWGFSGGSTPRGFYQMLAGRDEYRAIPWDKTHVWMVDERRVAEDDERSNFKMIREALGDRLPVSRDGSRGGIHPVAVLETDAAGLYERDLRAAAGLEWVRFPGRAMSVPRLDFVLLGMGTDGHTASLFPHSLAIGVRDRLIVTNEGPTVVPPARVTMTYSLINAGREVAVLITGKEKAQTLRRVDEQLRMGRTDAEALPITGIQPVKGRLTWYLDGAVAGGASIAS